MVTKIRVTYKDTDQMGVVYHGNYFTWLEIGRTDLMRSLGFSYREMEKEKIYLPVVEVSCRYKKPARYDEFVVIKASIEKLTPARIDFQYEIWDEAEENLLATGATSHAFMNDLGKPVNLKKENQNIWQLISQAYQK